MKIKRNILLILFVIFSNMTNNILAQDLSKLSESERNKKLIEIMPCAHTEIQLYWHHWKQQSRQLECLTLALTQQAKSILI